MDTSSAVQSQKATAPTLGKRFELRFVNLFNPGRALSFPCTETGEVLTESMSERALENYVCARSEIGCTYAVPQVRIA